LFAYVSFSNPKGLVMTHNFQNLANPVQLVCPACRSQHIETLDQAKEIGGTVGTVVGTAAGAGGILTGTEAGMAIGVAGGPVGMALGGLAGALVGALVGGTTGRTLGSNIGASIDEHILNNYQCKSCGHSFSGKSLIANTAKTSR